MKNGFSSQIVNFAKTLPPWQKILSKLAFDTTRLISEQEQEVEISIKRFMYDHGLSNELIGQEIVDEINALDVQSPQDSGLTPRLIQIKNCKHINAIASNQVITFAPKLTVIFGGNGSGKSGYVRLLNSVFYSRGDSKILPNILIPKVEQGEPESEFLFKIGDEEIPLKFPSDRDRPEFKHFACFDAKTVFAHLQNSNELYVMPLEMDFFDRLVQLVKIISGRLKNEALAKKKQNSFIDLLQGESVIKEFIKSLDSKTNLDDLRKLIGDIQVTNLQLEKVEKEYLELKHLSPENKLKEIREIKQQLENFKNEFEQLFKNHYNISYLDKIKRAIEALLIAKQSNQQVGVNSFKTEFLRTLGSDTWKKFILSAVSVVDDESKILQRKFPQANDHCPLCLQHLQSDALVLFERYFDFLKGESEQALKIADIEIKKLILEVNNFILPSLLAKLKLHSWLESNYIDEKKSLDETIQFFSSYQSSLKASLDNSDVTRLNEYKDVAILPSLSKIAFSLNDESKKYDEKNYQTKLKEKENLLTELKHKKLIFSRYDEIVLHVESLKWAERANVEAAKISTVPITMEHKRIFDDHFNKQYIQYFHSEAKRLNVDFRIDVTPTASYGRTSRKLSILSYPPSDILSEGQQKALALADFLTEIEICNINGGIIFDDPVNSLDHERKLVIAKRLVAESKKRQVVILTHDIGFLSDVKNEVESQNMVEGKDVYYHWVSKIENEAGVVTLNHRHSLESDFKKPDRALEYLNKANLETNPVEREQLCVWGFDCLRKTYEAFILYALFNGTVIRFDRQLKYGPFKDVYCPNDYIKSVSEKLEYCSGFINSHLHVDQSSGQKACPELLQQEIESFNKLSVKFKKERKSALKLDAKSFSSVS